jgi:hypothetical protein
MCNDSTAAALMTASPPGCDCRAPVGRVGRLDRENNLASALLSTVGMVEVKPC